MEEVKHNKCEKCKCWRLPHEFLNDKGRKLKSCIKCRDLNNKNKQKNKCEHNREKARCKECGGASICEHNKRKSHCKDCGGSQICQHNKIKSQCKECGGASICEHNKIKSQCKDCGGSAICEHNRIKSHCKKCDPIGHLADIVGSRIRGALKSNKSKKSIEYLNCDIEDFKKHIESKFLEGMNWDNHGKWHIDHIIPLQYQSPTIEQVMERLDWKNTQPLWATDNIAKGNRYIG